MSGTDYFQDSDDFGIEESHDALHQGSGHVRHPATPGPSMTPPLATPRVTLREIPAWRKTRYNRLEK